MQALRVYARWLQRQWDRAIAGNASSAGEPASRSTATNAEIGDSNNEFAIWWLCSARPVLLASATDTVYDIVVDGTSARTLQLESQAGAGYRLPVPFFNAGHKI